MNKFEEIPVWEKFQCKDILGNVFRAMKEEGNTVFVYAPRKKRKGWRFDVPTFLERYWVVEKTDENVKWHKRINRAIRCLENSGLWPEKLEFLKNLYIMAWDDHQAMNKLYWETPYPHNFNTPEWNTWFKKYPFLKYIDNDGGIFPNTEYLWELSEVKLKSMYFGKYNNASYKTKIKEALMNKQKYSIYREPVNYDVSFEYDPNKNMAWYSEEYRRCGNGHYYIAIDNSTAWFVEND